MVTGSLIMSVSEVEVDHFIRASGKPFYVYLLHRPGIGCFYVGKGTAKRLFCHVAEARNTQTINYRLNIIRQVFRSGSSVIYEIDSFHDLEQDAFGRERHLIDAIGRFDLGKGPLANMTDGGEGLANPSEETQARQRACWSGIEGDTDHALINRFFMRFLPETEAVPIKPLGKLRLQPLTPHPQAREISRRQCAALLASAVAHRIMLTPGCEVPRRLGYNGVTFVIENGAGRDLLKSGLACLSSRSQPCDEVFTLSKQGYEAIVRFFGRQYLESEGVLAPE